MKNKIFIIAGEKSGDNLGGKLIREILKLNPDAKIKFIGGSRMEKNSSAKSLFPMSDINLMGFAEILPHALKLIRRIKETVQKITEFKPDVLITIDSPGFNFRVVKKLREADISTNYVHYVAPSVWAYKPERAKKTADLYDKLISIIPWEKPYFEAEGLQTEYFGHPLFEDLNFIDEAKKEEIRQYYNIKQEDKIISILPGSRKGEVDKHIDVLKTSLTELNNEESLRLFFLPTPEIENYLRQKLQDIDLKFEVISEVEEKQKLLQISDLAMVKSGTVALEVAALGTPYFIFYKANPISAWFIKRLININYANLINISANQEIIPELIQENFNTEKVINFSDKILKDSDFREELKKQMAIEVDKFKKESNPSTLIAENIIFS